MSRNFRRSVLYFDPDRIPKKKGRADHRDKQRVLAKHFDNLFLFEALIDLVTDYENHLRVTGQTELLDQLLQMSNRERLQTAYSALQDDRSGLQKLIRRVAGQEEHSIDYSLNVERNRVSEKREQALYVDVRDGKIMPSPFDIIFDEAGEWLERAEFAVSPCECLLRDKRESG